MMNKCLLIVFFLFSLGFSFGEVRYFSDIFFNFSDATWKLYREVAITDLKGIWSKKHTHFPQTTFAYHYDSSKPKSFYKVFYNDQKQIIKITHSQREGGVFLIHVNDQLTSMSNTLEVLPNLPARIDFYYLSNDQNRKIHFLQIKNQYGGLEYTKHYDHGHADEIKIVTTFPKGKVKSLEIYKWTTTPTASENRNKIRYKIKHFSLQNADFIINSLSEEVHFDLNHLKDFFWLTNVDYSNLLDPDKEVIHYQLSPWEWKELILTSNKYPVFNHWLNNEIRRQVILKDDDLNFSFAKLDKKNWNDYVLTEYDEFDKRYFLKKTYERGLLKKTSKMVQKHDELIELELEIRQYFPNEKLFNISTYRDGKLVKEKQLHYLPEF